MTPRITIAQERKGWAWAVWDGDQCEGHGEEIGQSTALEAAKAVVDQRWPAHAAITPEVTSTTTARSEEKWEASVAAILRLTVPPDERDEVHRVMRWQIKREPMVSCGSLFVVGAKGGYLQGLYDEAVAKLVQWDSGVPGGRSMRIPCSVVGSKHGDLACLRLSDLAEIMRELNLYRSRSEMFVVGEIEDALEAEERPCTE